jgi:YebC/PmpR family DNA-binding regulatory protein
MLTESINNGGWKSITKMSEGKFGGKIDGMSGHSKWATTHRQKEANDAKRGAIFTKMAAAITVAVKQGGGIGDPDQNFRLRLVMEKAKEFNMPKDNISRAIEKGMGGNGADALAEVMYEGFLPGGVAVMVEVVTDNKIRTSQQIRMVLDKIGGSMGSSGAVSYMFSHKGQIIVNLEGKDPEEAELVIIDLGVDDIEADSGKLAVYCEKEKTFEVKEALEKLGYKVESAELIMKPTAWVEVGDEEMRSRIERGVEQLEDLDDVSHVWTNYA